MSSVDARKELLRLRGLFGGETDERAASWLDGLLALVRQEALIDAAPRAATEPGLESVDEEDPEDEAILLRQFSPDWGKPVPFEFTADASPVITEILSGHGPAQSGGTGTTANETPPAGFPSVAAPRAATEPCPDTEVESAESHIPYGQPCPICGPAGHAHHADDSYGACVTCREYVPHTDSVYVMVPWPCAPSLAALTPTSAPEPGS